MITVKEIYTKKEIKEFVKFPFQIFKNNPYWIPPIINEEVASFDKEKNPVFENADAFFYLAYNEKGKIVGRVIAIINKHDVEVEGIKKVRFGWLDMIDDVEVTKALINKIVEVGKAHNLEYME